MSNALLWAAARLRSGPLLLFEQWPWLHHVWHHILRPIKALFLALQLWGLPGVFIIAILDSSLLSIPEINDFLLIKACINNHHAIFYYPIIAASGSVIGCLILFHIARKGGQPLLHRRFSRKNVERVEGVFRRYGAISLILPSLCPPPTPFKIFVATAGALQYPRRRFIVAILIGRFTRYTVEAILAIIYGAQVLNYMRAYVRDYPGRVALVVLLMILTVFLVHRLISGLLAKREIAREIAREAENAMASGD